MSRRRPPGRATGGGGNLWRGNCARYVVVRYVVVVAGRHSPTHPPYLHRERVTTAPPAPDWTVTEQLLANAGGSAGRRPRLAWYARPVHIIRGATRVRYTSSTIGATRRPPRGPTQDRGLTAWASVSTWADGRRRPARRQAETWMHEPSCGTSSSLPLPPAAAPPLNAHRRWRVGRPPRRLLRRLVISAAVPECWEYYDYSS